MTAATLNAATIAAMIARAQAANHPDAWRDVALTLAESWPKPKRRRTPKTALSGWAAMRGETP